MACFKREKRLSDLVDTPAMKTLCCLLVTTLAMLPAFVFASDSIHNLSLTSIDGKEMPLKDFAGKAVLIVNVASECGYTGQYAGLQALHEKMAAKGLVVLGVPCNDFGGQEPGSEKEIKAFCTERYQVTFPMSAKVGIKSEPKHPLYVALTAAGGPVGWNFEKFLIGKDGKLVKHFKSDAEPDAAELQQAIEEALR
jgi:glutathione peroxidase